jgi:serine/threonine protein phosphatase PrpC
MFPIHISTATAQLCKGQDYVCSGHGTSSETGETFEWVMLNDGHGTNSCINFIRSIPQEKKSELIGSPDPIQRLAAYIDDSGCVQTYELSGATAVIIKLYKDRAECINCGDSQFIIFKDEELIHVSKEHNSYNEEERARMLNLGITFHSSTNIKVVSETTIASVPSEYAIFNNGIMLACTQALGHNSKTGYDPSVFLLHLEEDVSYRFVMGSDGLFDMVMMDNPHDMEKLKTASCGDICDWASARWQQEWDAHSSTRGHIKIKYDSHDCDDVSVAVINVEN